jgi:hypothetical protein
VLLPAAELDLRNALEAGKLSAEAVRGGDVMTIGAGEWPRLAWETNKHDEVIEFDRLLMLGAPRYEGVTLSRAAIMGLWPALDGWAPEESTSVDIDPADVREIRPEPEPSLEFSLLERQTSVKAPLRGERLKSFIIEVEPPLGLSKDALFDWLQAKAAETQRSVHRAAVREIHGTEMYPVTAARGRPPNSAE